MSARWEFHTSERVARFSAGLTVRQEARLLAIFDQMARHPMVDADDIPQTDSKGRRQWLRFRDIFAITFWIDHAEKEVRVRT